jgi:transposase
VISLEEWVDVVSLHRQGWGIKTIARELGISRNAVRRALVRGRPPEYHRRGRPSKLDPFKDYLVGRLADFPDLCAITLFEEIKGMGYEGGISILKDFTYPYRRKRREPVVRFETPPGRQAQVDWAHLGRHELLGKATPLYLFTMVLGYSRAFYAEVVTKMDIETFLALHARAFASFGGMPEEILYDNQKQVVLGRTREGARFHPTLLAFAGHYGFRPRACRPYRAKTKGKVERSIGYLKDRFFCGRTFRDLDDLNVQLQNWTHVVANERVHATTGEKPAKRLREEKLLPFAAAKPWTMPTHPAPTPPGPLFVFGEIEVQERPLSVYEEVLA